MAIMAECPVCKRKVAVKHKTCKCGEDLVKAKQGKRVKYHIVYRVKGKQKWQLSDKPYSIESARACEGKLRGYKAENRILEPLPDATMTFKELSDWYMGLEKVRALSSFWRIEIALNHFNAVFGNMVVRQIKLADLENFQAKRKAEGKADNTIDQEIGAAKGVVFKAFDNDMVGAETLKTFKRVKKMLRRNGNARKRVLSREEFEVLHEKAPKHIKGILLTAYHTGMRAGEIVNLTWDKVDLKCKAIRLEAKDTKDREARSIPISDELLPVFKDGQRIRDASEDNHIFTFRGKPIQSINKALRGACEAAKIPYGRFERGGFVFHDLRHTFNTNMRKAGISESVIMEITGHSTREMFDRYNTIDDEDKQKAIETCGAYFESVRQNVRCDPEPDLPKEKGSL